MTTDLSKSSSPVEGSGLHMRRSKSASTVESLKEQGEMKRRKRPDRPIHRPADSLFSWSSGFNDFGGFVNWGFLLLFLGGSRLALENILKYGVRIDPLSWVRILLASSSSEGHLTFPPSLFLLLYVNVHVIIALIVEKALANQVVKPRIGLTAHVVNLLLLLLTPIAVLHTWSAEVFSLLGATSVCFAYSIMFLKMWSYVQVNGWCREYHHLRKRRVSGEGGSGRSGKRGKSPGKVQNNTIFGRGDPWDPQEIDKDEVTYPDNLTVHDLAYFVAAPTLCYELNFPRTTRIRKRFLLRRLLELIFGFQLALALIQQWIIPSVKNSLIPFSNMDVMRMGERLLKLAIPNHLIWLIWFYLFFHCYMNVLGELLKFGDREFYHDWWNSTDIDTFWRTWNSPVHRWAVRHLYIPVIKKTNSKVAATAVTFFISAFFHEYLVSVPLRTYKVWAFMGMMAQVPLSWLCKIVVGMQGQRPRWGNVVVWASLILGQPLCIMMYYHDYVLTQYGPEFLASFAKLD